MIVTLAARLILMLVYTRLPDKYTEENRKPPNPYGFGL